MTDLERFYKNFKKIIKKLYFLLFSLFKEVHFSLYLGPGRAGTGRAVTVRAAVAEPALAEPARDEPALAEPAPAEPALAEPAPAELAPAEPAPIYKKSDISTNKTRLVIYKS